MAFMKKGTAVSPARPVGMKEWGMTKKASVETAEEQERLRKEAQAKKA